MNRSPRPFRAGDPGLSPRTPATTRPKTRRAARRLAAALGAAALGLGAFALPAAAQSPADDTEVQTPDDPSTGGTGLDADVPEGPFLYNEATYEAEHGDIVGARPDYLQSEPLPAGTKALVVAVTGGGRVGYAAPHAFYDNCVNTYPEVACVVTDFADLPGTVFRFADPVNFGIDDLAPGPVSICTCGFTVEALDAAQLEARYGDLAWDPGSENLFALEVEDAPDDLVFTDAFGRIDIRTTENPYDLRVEDVAIAGAEGDRVTVATLPANVGSGSAIPFFDGPGSYALIGDLPEGVELYRLDSDTGNVGELFCLDEEDWAVHLPEDVETGDLDFACFFQFLAMGDELPFTFTVDLENPDWNDVGRLEILALGDADYPGELDAGLGNNTADITLDGNGSGRLPATGASLGRVVGGAAAVLAAGVSMSVLTRRRKATAGSGE
ncbi:hypothetical protein [Glycomyces harbinensis]|uniref:LPXTG-motif cell wall anchor domain-containing protein n=1 Tax=Glycomyces harbinensis TaxID=58114 RepID=A0A1G7AR16_9ACTN|nr:hypothetical protein [Glycomyces harbinensis]SDE17253.1 hypothetical protein SAMN05216270_11499 [Glycomyces harbinensis]